VRKGYSITIVTINLFGSLCLVVSFYPELYALLGKLAFLLFLVMMVFGFFLFEFIVDRSTSSDK